jgi:hypothetical protein
MVRVDGKGGGGMDVTYFACLRLRAVILSAMSVEWRSHTDLLSVDSPEPPTACIGDEFLRGG